MQSLDESFDVTDYALLWSLSPRGQGKSSVPTFPHAYIYLLSGRRVICNSSAFDRVSVATGACAAPTGRTGICQ